MYTFKQFIKEVFDKPYQVTLKKVNKIDWGNGEYHQSHHYGFTDHKGTQHEVVITHDSVKPHESEVNFRHEGGGYRATHDQGHHAVKILSSVGDAMKKYAADNTHVKSLTFTSDKEDESDHNGNKKEGIRNKLYRRFTDMLGGETTNGRQYLTHSVPVNQGK